MIMVARPLVTLTSYIKTFQAFGGVLVDHILYAASPPGPRLALISSLLLHLRTLIKMYPRQIADHFIGKLMLMHKNLKRGLSHGAKTWPGLPELVLLRVLGALWPTSDMHHAVVSPARLLMGSYLGLCKIRSLPNATSGLFLCTLFLQFESLSKRFVPETINFLIGVIQSLSPRRGASIGSGKTFSSSRYNKRLCVIDSGEAAELSVNRPDLVALIGDEKISAQTNVDLLGLAVDLLAKFSEAYKAVDGFVELYSPVLEVLNGANFDVLCPMLQVMPRIHSCLLSLKFCSGQIHQDFKHHPKAFEVLAPIAPASTPPSTQTYPNSNFQS